MVIKSFTMFILELVKTFQIVKFVRVGFFKPVNVYFSKFQWNLLAPKKNFFKIKKKINVFIQMDEIFQQCGS